MRYRKILFSWIDMMKLHGRIALGITTMLTFASFILNAFFFEFVLTFNSFLRCTSFTINTKVIAFTSFIKLVSRFFCFTSWAIFLVHMNRRKLIELSSVMFSEGRALNTKSSVLNVLDFSINHDMIRERC